MKKQLSVGLAVMALAASLTACGGGSSTTTTTTAAAPASESPAAPPRSATAASEQPRWTSRPRRPAKATSWWTAKA